MIALLEPNNLPTITLNNLSQAAPIALADARTVAPLVVGLLVTRNVKVLVNRPVREHVQMDAKELARLHAKILVNRLVGQHASMDAKKAVICCVKMDAKTLVIMPVLIPAKPLVVVHVKAIA